ncbi:MAG: sugar phosphate nucleotidyltransferase [Verrucomicrobiota bacterium]
MNKENVQGDLLVVAGDNLFDSSLAPFVEFARSGKTPVLALYDVGDLESIKKYNSITLDENGIITFFEEKPKNPTSTLTGIALYYFPADVVKLLDTYIAEGNNPDQPGRFIQWLYPRVPVRTWRVPGRWFDIGSKETLEEAVPHLRPEIRRRQRAPFGFHGGPADHRQRHARHAPRRGRARGRQPAAPRQSGSCSTRSSRTATACGSCPAIPSTASACGSSSMRSSSTRTCASSISCTR